MKTRAQSRRRGFSLVELLAVVLVLAVLAAVAIPLYTSQRQSAAARACRANLSAIQSSLSAYALRNNQYPAALSDLVGKAEGLTEVPKCPLGQAYTYNPGTQPAAASLKCGDASTHVTYNGATADYEKTLPKPADDKLP